MKVPSEKNLRRTQRRVFKFYKLLSNIDTDMPTISTKEPTILVANHRSLADLFLAASLFHVWSWPVRPLVAGAYFKKPLIGSLLKKLGAVPVSGSDAIESAAEILSTGVSVAVMAEGRVVPPEEWKPTGVGEPKIGVAKLSLKSNCPVLAIGVAGTEDLWPRGRTLPRLSLRRRNTSSIRLKSLGIIEETEPEAVLSIIWDGVKEMVEAAEAERKAN